MKTLSTKLIYTLLFINIVASEEDPTWVSWETLDVPGEFVRPAVPDGFIFNMDENQQDGDFIKDQNLYIETVSDNKYYCGPKAYLESQGKCVRNTEYWGEGNSECIPTILINDVWMVSIKNGCMTTDSENSNSFTNINYQTEIVNP